MYKYITCLVLCFFMACSPEKPAQTVSQPPSPSAKGDYVLEITPKDVDRTGMLSAVAQGFSLSDATMEWLVNGQPVPGEETSQFKLMNTKKGDTVQGRAILQGKEILSDSIIIKNAAPEISKIKIMPEVFRPGDTLSVEVSASDIDGDDVSISYEWIKNGEPAGNEKQMAGTVKRGDKVSVKITPFDGETYGRPVILKREIRNLPPMIVEDKKIIVKGDLFTYKVKAVDPDGDTLSYALNSAPRGMAIDQATGMIRWNIPADFQGKASFAVTVSDGNGGEAKQDLVFKTRVEPENRQ